VKDIYTAKWLPFQGLNGIAKLKRMLEAGCLAVGVGEWRRCGDCFRDDARVNQGLP
tara:strand:+ start:424 stop:591 length:168 start_codon:yes stop_codon:yes gene_type:complete